MESEMTSVKEELLSPDPEDANLSTSSTLRPTFWCRNCDQEATEECAETHVHALTSLRMLRAGQAAPKLQRLQDAATSARQVVQALTDTRNAVEAQLEQWRGRLRKIEETHKELLAAAEEGRDLEAFRVEGLEVLVQDAASLVGARCKLGLEVEKGGTKWRAKSKVAFLSTVLYPLMLQLQQDGSLAKILCPEECKDVRMLSAQREHTQELDDVLQDPALLKVRWLGGVDCSERPNWCKMLLQRVAPRVETLWVEDALREHLEVIQTMPALRHLYLHLDVAVMDVPDLPLQLQELDLQRFSTEYAKSVQCMPNLRKLTLDCFDGPVDMTFPPLPPHHHGLQWLRVYFHPESTVLSLAKAHAATLMELRILCASEGETPWHFQGLAAGLRQCGLVALRRVVLMRTRNINLPHAKESCTPQKKAIWDALLSEDSDKSVKVVKVLCESCNECPEFPALGVFTWKDK